MRIGKRVAIAGGVLALGGFIAGLTPAQAAPSGAQAIKYHFVFDKKTNTDSRLILVKTQPNKPAQKVASWRAGSGTTTDSCAKNKGWLPNGTYEIKRYNTNYNGSLIKGYAFQLSDKRCKPGGTLRNELFIHSEMKRDGNQGSTEPTRWDGNSDYKSAGCIKLKPSDIRSVYKTAKSVGFPRTLKVVS